MTENLRPGNPHRDTPDDRQHPLDRKRYTVERVTLVVLFVYVTIAAFQWYEMRRATIATEVAARATQDAAKTAADALRLTYRPRITVTKIYPQEKLDNGKLAIGLSVFNYGPITARNVRVFRFENVSALERASKLPYGSEPLRDYPKMLAPTKADDWGIYGEKVLSPQQIKALGSRQLVATFSVLVEYEDDSSQTHHTEACILYTLRPKFWWTYCQWPVQID
jgi:hypothetical protein